MEKERRRLYTQLLTQIGRTLVEEYRGPVPRGNKIFLKRECDNLFGSHYDRVYFDLFKYYEEQGRIKPGDVILETTSGSAGISFAGIGKHLGYQCRVAIPAGGEKARVAALQAQGAEIIFTDAAKYISGFPEFLRAYLAQHKNCFFMSHSMGKRGGVNEITLSALEMIAHEVEHEQLFPDYFIPAVGNGSSVVGVGRGFGKATKIVAFETVQSAVLHAEKYPGLYEAKYGIEPGSLPLHKLPGTSFQGIRFPHIIAASKMVHSVELVSDAHLDEEYYRLTGRVETNFLAHWDDPLPYTAEFGRSTRAGIAVALSIAEQTSVDKTFLVIAYDKAERYDG